MTALGMAEYEPFARGGQELLQLVLDVLSVRLDRLVLLFRVLDMVCVHAWPSFTCGASDCSCAGMGM